MVKKLIVSLLIHCTMETLTPLLMALITLRAPGRRVRHIYIFIYFRKPLPALPKLQAQIYPLFPIAHSRIKVQKKKI